jgi:probable rRNA maturation factor
MSVRGRRSRRLAVEVVASAAWRTHARGLARWLERAAPARARGRITLALVGDRAMQDLNHRFRGADEPTDVLSFPAGRWPPPNGWRSRPGRPGARPHVSAGSSRPRLVRGKPDPTTRAAATSKSHHDNELGDVAIALGVARRQARRFGHPVGTELRVLALHGLLHLLGYDHERDQGQMLRLEARLRRRMNLPAGLLTRAPRPRPRR